ncbi:helix-turn-helix transcriptional regulator [Psychrobacter raelei]|uniref:helix-turn-helix transcriptional regulator n=1 Tax=Psychrobacter raelei TaxID=2565531 RepID=UPI003F62139F
MENLRTTKSAVEQCNHIPQLLNIKHVIEYTGLSRSSIYEMINEDSDRYDPTFPKKVQLSKVRVAWVASEVAEWINSKMNQRMM